MKFRYNGPRFVKTTIGGKEVFFFSGSIHTLESVTKKEIQELKKLGVELVEDVKTSLKDVAKLIKAQKAPETPPEITKDIDEANKTLEKTAIKPSIENVDAPGEAEVKVKEPDEKVASEKATSDTKGDSKPESPKGDSKPANPKGDSKSASPKVVKSVTKPRPHKK